MNIILNKVILSLVLMIFPILIYFIYCIYSSLCNKEKYNNLVFCLCILTSIYLIFKYGYRKEILVFLDIPLIITYLKKKTLFGILLSIFLIININSISEFNISIIIIKYLSIFIFYYYYKDKKYTDTKFINIISVIEAFALSADYFYKNPFTGIGQILELFLLSYLFYLLPLCTLSVFKIVDKITSLYASSIEMERDKQLKNSLFKITHEVKNPIAVCKGYLDMLDPNDINKTKKYLPILKDEINRSLNIMTDFMEFSKIKLNKDILDINMLLSEVSSEISTICNNRITIKYHENTNEIYLNGDYCRIKQVLINILKNSVEAIPNTGTITINTYQKSQNYYIEIADNGIGMDKDTLDHISEMFFTTKVRGSGLGVALSKEIIKAHNGSIKYNSTLGKGTKVTIKFPIYSC